MGRQMFSNKYPNQAKRQSLHLAMKDEKNTLKTMALYTKKHKVKALFSYTEEGLR